MYLFRVLKIVTEEVGAVATCDSKGTYLVIFKTRKITSTANDLFLTLHPPPSIRKSYFRLGGCSVKFLSNKMDSAFLLTPLLSHVPTAPTSSVTNFKTRKRYINNKRSFFDPHSVRKRYFS